MTREELIAYDRWLTENKWGSSDIITPEQAADLYLAKHPLPPAEGAEQRIRVRNILQDFYRRGEYELEQAEEDIMRLFQPQPTAEGAEEILDKYPHSIEYPSFVHENSAIAAMTEFATLHAQRIAEKMVAEDDLQKLMNDISDLISEHYVAKEAAGYPLEFVEWLIKDQEIFFGELNEEYILNDNIHMDGRKLQTIDELFNYWEENER